jgi:phage terminase large subunit-like protein
MAGTACSTEAPPTVSRPLVATPTPGRGGHVGDAGSAPCRVEGAWYDQAAVEKVRAVFRQLRHSKGRRFQGTPFELTDWQVDWIVAPVFGWKNPDGTRVVRTLYVEIPRKQGKSAIASGFALVLLAADGEPGAEVYAAAGSLKQAGRVFDEAKTMVRRSPALNKRCRSLRSTIEYPATDSVFTVVSSAGDLAHGLNVSGAVIDELHVHKKRDLVDAIETGVGFRDQPLIIIITTADDGDDYTIYAEKHEYCRKVAAGIVVDPTFYGVIWAAEDDDDPLAEATWEKVMPGLDVTVKRDFLRSEALKAANSPQNLVRFRRLYLNQRLRATSRWLDLASWDLSAGLVDESRLKGRRAWGGLDLSSVSDMTAYVMVVEDPDDDEVLKVVPKFWLPREVLPELQQRLNVPFEDWVRDGLLELTEGNAIDYDVVQQAVLDSAKQYDLQQVSYDRLFAGQLVQNLAATRIDVAPVSQTFVGLSTASKELERMTLTCRLQHGGHKVLRWHAECVEVLRDNSDNIKPVKPDRNKSTKRIDGIAAEVMALDGYLRRPVKARRRAAGF